MKKALINFVFTALVINAFFSFKLSAYEYLYQEYFNDVNNYHLRFITDEYGTLWLKNENYDGSVTRQAIGYDIFYSSKMHGSNSIYKVYDIKDYYEKDLKFLNDLYEQQTNKFLNYLYNDNVFNNINYINYENYELLYNDQGLAVESIVNGKWAGLYDNKKDSGLLYNSSGKLKYRDGEFVGELGQYFDFSFLRTCIFQAGYAILSISIGFILCCIVYRTALYISTHCVGWYNKNISVKGYPKE